MEPGVGGIGSEVPRTAPPAGGAERVCDGPVSFRSCSGPLGFKPLGKRGGSSTICQDASKTDNSFPPVIFFFNACDFFSRPSSKWFVSGGFSAAVEWDLRGFVHFSGVAAAVCILDTRGQHQTEPSVLKSQGRETRPRTQRKDPPGDAGPRLVSLPFPERRRRRRRAEP